MHDTPLSKHTGGGEWLILVPYHAVEIMRQPVAIGDCVVPGSTQRFQDTIDEALFIIRSIRGIDGTECVLTACGRTGFLTGSQQSVNHAYNDRGIHAATETAANRNIRTQAQPDRVLQQTLEFFDGIRRSAAVSISVSWRSHHLLISKRPPA